MYWRAVVAIGAATLGASCRTSPPEAIDRSAASCVPPDTVVVAGVDLERLRGSAVYSQLPMLPALTEWSGQASYLLAAFNGQELLTVARGSFRLAPAGWTFIEPGLAASGSDTLVHRAMAFHKQKDAAKPPVLREAEEIAAGKPLWIVARGGIELPLPGNARNLNPLLARSEYAYLTVTLGPELNVQVVFVGASGDAASNLEKTLRGFLGLSRMTEKDAQVSAILGAVKVARDGRTVQASVAVTADGFSKLTRGLAR